MAARGAREEATPSVGDRARELFGPRFGSFVVGDATQDVPAQKQQFNELGLDPGIEPSREGLPRLSVDLRLQIAERDDTCRGGWLGIDHVPVAAAAARLDITACSFGLVERAASGRADSGRGSEIREDTRSRYGLLVDTVADPAPLPALINVVKMVSAMSSFGLRPPQVSWLPLQQRPLDLEVTLLGVASRHRPP